MPPTTREEKCQAAREVIDLLNQNPPVPVLHVGGLALDQWHQDWRRWGTKESDDLHLLIRHEDLKSFMDRMEGGGYSLADYQPKPGTVPPTGTVVGVKQQDATQEILDRPVGPHAAYVEKKFIGQVGHPDLWTRFHTTTRHGALLLIDLADWFDHAESVPAMEDLHPGTMVNRPPLWTLLLWQAAQVTASAADCAITKDEVDQLHVIAAHMKRKDWETALDTAKDYDEKHRKRVDYCVDILKKDRKHLKYGILYELRYALEALTAYGHTAGYQADWEDVMVDVQAGTGAHPRKLWGYVAAKRGKYIPPRASRGVVGTVDLDIHTQIEKYGGYSYDEFKKAKLIQKELPPAPPHAPWDDCPHAPWDDCKEQEVKAIFAVKVRVS